MIRVLGAVLLAAALAACTSQSSPSPAPTATAVATSAAPTAKPAALLSVHDPGHVTGTLTGHCAFRDGGQLPDPRCTPGAIDPAVTAAVLCSPGYRTSPYRPPASATDRFKWDVAAPAYGIAPRTKGELDHLVPLELGGANDAANLWIEQGPIPNVKDGVERALHDAVCSGRVTLAAAQRAIAGDWMTAEAVLGIGGTPLSLPTPTHPIWVARGVTGITPTQPAGTTLPSTVR